MENETEEMETKSNEEAANLLMPKEYLKSLLSRAEIEVIEDSGIMRTILDEGKRVQKMAAKYGTNQDIDGEEAFNGFGTYVVSVNEENARQLGIKIASKKYGGNFYINGQPFNEFLREKNFSPYWTSRMEHFSGHNVEYLADDFLRADVKGNPALEKERDTLSTLFSLDLVEYKRERAFLYSVDIPDNDSTNYLLYGNPIGIESANRINDRLERMNAEWRVTRNDIGKNVYFNTLSEKVFGGSQESASRFLKEIGYVGMEMNAANYIVFDDKDMKVTDRVQYMIDGESNVYGFAYDGRIYADPEIATSNAYAHEYTHLWDAYTRRTNPELWEKGKDIFKGTSLWNEVMTDENYQNLSDDDEILSECHSRIVGRMAEKVLSRIAEKNGGLLRDQVIDWDNEVAEYVAGELGAEFPQPELGGESYVSDSVRLEIAREFLSRPMKDLMEGRKITQNVPFQNIIQEMAEDHAFPDAREYFKFNRTDSENFEKALDNFDGRNPLQLIKVGEIPPVMKALGISDNPIEMPQSVVSKALREEATYPNDKKGHALTMEHVKRIPESLADPIMVFKSRTRDDSYVFFTEQKDESDRSIIIPVAVDKRYGRLVINEITSIYGRTNEVDFVKTNIEQGNLVYADKKRSLEWERECQVQFLAQVLPSEGSYSSILTKENLVNFVSAVGKEKIQKMAQSVENAIAEPTAEAWAKDIETKLNLGMEQDISKILAESEAVGVKENAGEIAGEICGAILSVYKEIAEHGDTGYFEGGERQMSNKFAGNCTQKVLEAHGIFLPNYPDESGEREKLFSTIQQVSDEIFDFIKTNTYENFLHRQDVGIRQDIGLADNEMTAAERPNRGAETDYADPIETAEAWHNGTDGEPEENVAAARKTVRASEIFKDFEESMIFSGISHKQFDRAMLDYLHQRSGREEAENGTFDKQAMFEFLVAQQIHDKRARSFALDKIERYEGMTVEFDADNIDLGYLRLSDREGAEEVRKELEELKAAHPILVRNLAGRDEPVAKAEQNPFLAAEPELVQELHEQAEAVEKMQQEAASNVEFDKDGNPYYPKSEAAEENAHPVSKEKTFAGKNVGKNVASGIVEPSAENEPKEKRIEIKDVNGKISEINIEFGKTAIAKFAMVTQNGLKSYSDMAVASYEKTTDSYLLVSEDKSQQVRVQSSTMAALLSDERQKEIEKTNSQIEENKKLGRSTENLEVKKEMLEQGISVAQYNDFFQTRENCANNFRHNLSVMCRKEANSPLDALKIANKIITQMSDSEKLKTRDLLDLLRKDGQSRNEVLVDVYNEAVKATPLNEQYLLSQRYDKIIARPMYDTVSGRGEKIDGNFNLKVGDTVKMVFNVNKDIAFEGTKLERRKPVFGNKELMFSECKIISSSKEGNVVTLMDGNKSFYDVPRDTFLKEYAKREKYEKKQEIKEAHKKNIMRLDIER